MRWTLGLIWLLDGALQFQAFMYGSGFISTLRAGAVGQPLVVADTINWAAGVMHWQQPLLNTSAALAQVAIGLGLMRRFTARPALILSFGWALSVWWFGEGFGMVLTASASPLSGAPGAALIYLLIGLIVWPGARAGAHGSAGSRIVSRSGERAGGLLGPRGARLAWAALWILAAWEWLRSTSANPNAVSRLLASAPSGMGWLSTVQQWCARAAVGDGLPIGLLLALISVAIGVAVYYDWHARAFLKLSIALSLVFWVVGQGFGGIFAGGATDPNAGPLFALLAAALYWTVLDPPGRKAASTAAAAGSGSDSVASGSDSAGPAAPASPAAPAGSARRLRAAAHR